MPRYLPKRYASKRYVPKTYNNRRALRVILGTISTLALSFVILFLVLFFVLSRYVEDDGQLVIPWLIDEPAITASSVE